MKKFWRCLSGYNAAIDACAAVTKKVAAFNGVLEAHKTSPSRNVRDIKHQVQKMLGYCAGIPRK